jgi:solute carrier family 30 (zinc transporter), member 2
VLELSGGYIAGSLAIMSDAAHLITDSLTFVIGAFAINWGRKKPDSKMSFGYKRVEVFCAIISIFGIWILTIFILYFAVQRLLNLDGFNIDTDAMLICSILGVLVNIV